MLSAFVVLLLAGGDAGVPLEVPLGAWSWNGHQPLALSSQGIAVRELTLSDTEEPECVNPGMPPLLKGRTWTEAPLMSAERQQMATFEGAEFTGVTLHLWPLPAVGAAEIPHGLRRVVYASGGLDAGCTTEGEATAALKEAKGWYTDAGLDLASPPRTAVFFTQLEERSFRGNCYRTRTSKSGCSMKREARLGNATARLTLNLLINSDCVAEGRDDEYGCQRTQRYRGTIEYLGRTTAFELLTPRSGISGPFSLENAVLWESGDTTVAVFTFSFCFVSCRERSPAVIRLR